MTSSAQKTLAAVSALGCVFGIAIWALYFGVFKGIYGADWLVFWSAARAFFDHDLAIVYDGTRLTAAINSHFSHWLVHPPSLHPWLYPPSYLLLLLPFALLPALAAGMACFAGTVALFTAAITRLSKATSDRLVYVLAALLSPGAAVAGWLGQNTFLSAGLLIGGFTFGRRRPLLGGALLGLLTFKPQFWLMVPIALIAARQWKMLFAALATAAAVSLASLAVFGPQIWADWLHLMLMPNALFKQWQAVARDDGLSLFACARVLGASVALANAVQYAGAALAAVAVWQAFRRPFPADIRVAVLVLATAIAAPHIMNYDATLYCIAASLLFVHNLRRNNGLADTVISFALWLSPLINPPIVFPAGLATPLLATLVMLRLFHRAEAPQPVENGALPTPFVEHISHSWPIRGLWQRQRTAVTVEFHNP